jgi:Rrf2 family protein
LRLSKRTEYGLRAAVQLARLWPHDFVQSKDLAQREGLPGKFLESILLALRWGGFLESKVGSGGGYRLSRSPREITVGDIIRRLEGRLTVANPKPATETSIGRAAIQLVNERLTQATQSVLEQLTLAELLDLASRTVGQQAMYYI